MLLTNSTHLITTLTNINMVRDLLSDMRTNYSQTRSYTIMKQRECDNLLKTSLDGDISARDFVTVVKLICQHNNNGNAKWVCNVICVSNVCYERSSY